VIDMQLKGFFRSTTSETPLVGAEEAGYVDWRRASDAVAESYRGWVRAQSARRWLAYAAYQAALDREEEAARTYQKLVEQL
jgi:hypothetical protein